MAHIEEHHVFDKLADAGCGLYGAYRWDDFEKVVFTGKKVVEDLEKDLSGSG